MGRAAESDATVPRPVPASSLFRCRRRTTVAAFAAALCAPLSASADEPATPPFPTPITALGDDLIDAFSGTHLIYFGLAVAETPVLSLSGADFAIRRAIQENLRAPAFGDAAYYTGYIAPAVVAPGLYLIALAAGDSVLAGGGAAATQALAITLATTLVLKVGTGRPFPNDGNDPRDPRRLDDSQHARSFAPFAFSGRYAWPSGHTSSTISIAAALTAFYPDELWVPFVSYPIALAIGAGMLVGDHHWASDVIAGALIGQAIGGSVGRNFRARASKGSRAQTQAIDVAPLVAPGVYGLRVMGSI
jgi:membrane-associated phospholipid phosphatase